MLTKSQSELLAIVASDTFVRVEGGQVKVAKNLETLGLVHVRTSRQFTRPQHLRGQRTIWDRHQGVARTVVTVSITAKGTEFLKGM